MRVPRPAAMITTSTGAVATMSEVFVMHSSCLSHLAWWRIIRSLLALGAAALLLGGCSAVRLGYSQLPELAYWWLDNYLDFDDTQGPLLRAELQTLHDWHRREELPQIAAELAQLQALAQRPVTSTQLCQWTERLRPRVQAVLTRAEPALLQLLPTLSTGQLAHLRQQLQKRHQQWRQDWLQDSPAERQATRLQRWQDRAEDFYGKLNAAQGELLRQAIASSPFDAALEDAERMRRQQDLLQTLQQIRSLPSARGDDGTARDLLRALWQRNQNSPNPVYRRHAEQIAQSGCESWAALHNSTSPTQRQRLLDKLRGYEDDARSLAPSAR